MYHNLCEFCTAALARGALSVGGGTGFADGDSWNAMPSMIVDDVLDLLERAQHGEEHSFPRVTVEVLGDSEHPTRGFSLNAQILSGRARVGILGSPLRFQGRGNIFHAYNQPIQPRFDLTGFRHGLDCPSARRRARFSRLADCSVMIHCSESFSGEDHSAPVR